jgi:hypothetical protein
MANFCGNFPKMGILENAENNCEKVEKKSMGTKM